MRLPYDDQLRVPPICSGIQEKYPIPGESWAELYHALETCHKRAGPHLSLPHDADDDEHTDSTCTLLLCVRGEGKWLLLKKQNVKKKKKKVKKNFTKLPLNAQELPLISAQFTNNSVWILGCLMLVVEDLEIKSKLNHSDCDLNTHIRVLRLTRDYRLVYYLSGAVSTLMESWFDSTRPAALNPTPSFTILFFFCFCFSVLLCEMFIHVASFFSFF